MVALMQSSREVVLSKASAKFSTLDTSQLDRGWLNAVAEAKVDSKLVTRDTSHVLTSSLKPEQALLQPELARAGTGQKTNDRSVTADTFHVPIAPYVAAALVESPHHASRAVSRAVRFAKAC